MKGMIRLFFITCFIVFVGSNLFSQTLSLPEAINIALKNSLDLQLQRNEVQKANINNHIGVAGGLPLITASVSDNQQITNVDQELNNGTHINRSGAVGNNLQANVTAGILLYNGSRVLATKNRLAQLQQQSEEQLNSKVQNTMAQVMLGYYDIVRQQAYIKTVAQSIELAAKRLDIIKTRQEAGLANNADLFQSQLDLNSLLQTKQSQELVLQQAKTELLTLLNLPPDSTIFIQDTIVVDKSILLGNVLSSLEKNSDITAADDQIKITRFTLKEVGAQRYPSLRASAGYNYNRSQTTAGNLLLNQSSGPVAGLSLSVPIYNGSSLKRQEQVAAVNVKNAELQKEILKRNYLSLAVQTYQGYVTSLKLLESQQKNVDLASKLVDLALLRLQLRQSTIVDVRLAQQSLEEAAYTLTNLSFSAKSAEIELNRLVNQIRF